MENSINSNNNNNKKKKKQNKIIKTVIRAQRSESYRDRFCILTHDLHVPTAHFPVHQKGVYYA
jgi:hypothetical protein